MNMFIIKGVVPEDVGRVRVDPVRVLWLWGMALPGLVSGLPALGPATGAL